MDFLSGISPSVWFAMGGAFAIKLLELTELYKIPPVERPDLKDFLYWLPFLILPCMGGGLAYAYVSSESVLSPLLSINVGVSAPLILRAMVQANPIESTVLNTPEGA